MTFHRFTQPAYPGAPVLPAGPATVAFNGLQYNLFNVIDGGTGAGGSAFADAAKIGGANAGTYMTAHGEDAITANLNRGLRALAENCDHLDNVVQKVLAISLRTADVVAMAPVASIALPAATWVGAAGTPNTVEGINTFVEILDELDNEIVSPGVPGTRCVVTAIAGAVVGTDFSAGIVTLTVAPPIPAGKTYRVYYATRSSLAGLPTDALININIRGAQEVSADLMMPGGGSLIGYVGGPAWLDATANPATTVSAQLSKIISDLVNVAGSTRINSNGYPPAVVSKRYGLATTSVRGQLVTLTDDINAQQYKVTCGDGVVTFGDFNGTDAIKQAVTWLATTPSTSWHIVLKEGTYLINPGNAINIPASTSLSIEGASRAGSIITFNMPGGPGITGTTNTELRMSRLTLTRTGGVQRDHIELIGGCLFTMTEVNSVEVGVLLVNPKRVNAGNAAYAVHVQDCFIQNGNLVASPFCLRFGSGDLMSFVGYYWERCKFQGSTDVTCIQFSQDGVGNPVEVRNTLFKYCQFNVVGSTMAGGNLVGNSGPIEIIADRTDASLHLIDLSFEDCDVLVDHGNTPIILYLRTGDGARWFKLDKLRITRGRWVCQFGAGPAGSATPFYIGGNTHLDSTSVVSEVLLEDVTFGWGGTDLYPVPDTGSYGISTTEVAGPTFPRDWAAFFINCEKLVVRNIKYIGGWTKSICGDWWFARQKVLDIDGLEFTTLVENVDAIACPTARVRITPRSSFPPGGAYPARMFRRAARIVVRGADIAIPSLFSGESGGIVVLPAGQLLLDSCVVHDMGGGTQANGVLLNVSDTAVGGGGIVNQYSGLHLRNCELHKNSNNGFHCTAGYAAGTTVITGLRIEGCHMEANGRSGIYIWNDVGAAGSPMLNLINCIISNNLCRDNVHDDTGIVVMVSDYNGWSPIIIANNNCGKINNLTCVGIRIGSNLTGWGGGPDRPKFSVYGNSCWGGSVGSPNTGRMSVRGHNGADSMVDPADFLDIQGICTTYTATGAYPKSENGQRMHSNAAYFVLLPP